MSATNTTSALSVGELALALVVGVDRYRDKAIEPLGSAADEARLLGRTLTDPKASRLLEKNVVVVVDDAATRDVIVDALERMAVAAGPAQAIFFYFAGHAIDADGGFALIAHDTDRSNLARTGIGSSTIDRILSASAARGILVVVDCCGGAALAENAPGLFRTVGRRSEYRILLSSARAGQSSWEGRHGSRFSRALIDALAGRAAVAGEAGAIFFSDLYRHLHDSVTTAPDAGDIEAARQEPIAVASYARDPLLFVNADLTLAQVRVRVQRYSKAQMRAALRRWSIAAAAALALGAAGLLAYLHGHQYLTVEGDVVALYRGVPGWRLFDYPALLWQFGVDRDELDARSPLFRNVDLVSAWREDYRSAVLEQLDPVGQARWQFNDSRSTLARPLLDAALADPTNNPRWTRAALIFAALAGTADVPRLVELTRSGQANVTTAALGRLASLAPEQALEAARRIGLDTIAVHLQVLADVQGRCDEAIGRYVDEFATAGANGQFARLVIDVALRLGCPLSNEALGAINQPVFLRDAARYLDIADPARGRRFRDHYARKVEIALRTGTDTENLGDAAAYLAAAKPGDRCLDVSSFDALPAVDPKLSMAGAYLAQCPAAMATLQAKPEGGWRYVVENAASDAAPIALDLPPGASAATLWTMLGTLDAARADRSLAALRAMAVGDGNPLIRIRATRLLRSSGAPAPADISAFVRTGDHALQSEAYLWWAQHDRASALAALLERLGDETAGFIPQTLAQWNLSMDERRRIVDAARTSKVSGATRGLIVAMFGTVDEVNTQLSDPRYDRRQWAFDGLGFRDDLAVVAERLPAPYAPGGTTAQNLGRLAEQRDRLAGEFAELTGNARDWRIKLMLDLRQLNNTGLVLWLQSRCRGCD